MKKIILSLMLIYSFSFSTIIETVDEVYPSSFDANSYTWYFQSESLYEANTDYSYCGASHTSTTSFILVYGTPAPPATLTGIYRTCTQLSNVADVKNYYITYSTVAPINCDSVTEDLINGQCVPKCSSGTTRDSDGQCVCKAGYNDSETFGTCVPDIDCPVPPMIYKFVNVDWGLDTRSCVPDSNFTETQCNADGFVYARYLDEDPSDGLSMYASVFGDGCITSDYASKVVDDVLWHTFVSGLLPSMGVSASLLAQDLTRLFSSGKNLYRDIATAFKNSPLDDVKLLTYKPKITEIQMADDGIFYEVEAVAMNADDVAKTTYNKQAYNQYLKDNGYISAVDDLPVAMDNIEFPTVLNNMDDLFYRGADSTKFINSMLGTANISKNGKLPNLTSLETAPLNSQVETVTSINSKLKGTQVKDYPTYIVKTSKINLADRVETKYKGYIKYPDGTKTDLAINRVKYLDDGRIIDDITTTQNIPVKSGTRVFNTNYQTYTDSSGAVSNVINSPSSITTTTTGGTTTTTNTSTNSVTTNTTQSAVDLSPVVQKLESIDDKLRAIINTTIPPEIAEASLKLSHFNVAQDLFDVDFNTYKNFINGLIDNINELGTLFDDTKAILENKPQINEITGTCGFSVTFIQGQAPLFVDPCMFVAPYRPLLALIFTLFGTFSVIGFSVKYLVSKGD